MYYYEGQRGPRPRATTVTPLSGFLRWVVRVLRKPTPVMIEVTYEIPLLRCVGLLLAIYLAVALSLIVIGEEGLVNFGGGSFAERLQRGVIVAGGLTAGLAVYVVITHWVAHWLEGVGSLVGLATGAVFSLVPFLLFAAASLVLGILPIGESKSVFQGLVLFVTLGWTAFLYKVAVQENNSFTDVQAVISLLLPPAVLTISVGVVFVVGYMLIILFFP